MNLEDRPNKQPPFLGYQNLFLGDLFNIFPNLSSSITSERNRANILQLPYVTLIIFNLISYENGKFLTVIPDKMGFKISTCFLFLSKKGDICDPAGCLSELCIQLAIIMVGKQVWNNFMEYLFP